VASQIPTIAAEILGLYKVTSIHGDRYSAGWNAGEWNRAGFRCVASEQTECELYLSVLPMFLSGQTAAAIRRLGKARPNGRDSVENSGAASSHHDLRTQLHVAKGRT